MEKEDTGLREHLQALVTEHCKHPAARVIREYVGRHSIPVRRLLAEQTLWTFGVFSAPDGRRCLVEHVRAIQAHLNLPVEEIDEKVALSFDSVASEMGLWAAVALVKDACGALK
jgi:hypothetical protein